MVMIKALKIIGAMWALLGTANILLGMYSTPTPDGLPSFGVMFNVALFVVPGLIIYGIGEWNFRKLKAQSKTKSLGESRCPPHPVYCVNCQFQMRACLHVRNFFRCFIKHLACHRAVTRTTNQSVVLESPIVRA